MSRCAYLYAGSALAITIGLGLATTAAAQGSASPSGNQVEELVITGSLSAAHRKTPPCRSM